jgi:Rod binding domain-containing protein
MACQGVFPDSARYYQARAGSEHSSSTVRCVQDAAKPSNSTADEKNALARLRKVCGEFEGFFLAQLMRVMRENPLKSEFLDGGVAQDVLTEEMFFALGESLGERSGLGIARMLYEQMARRVVPEAYQGTGAGGRCPSETPAG